MDGDVFVYMSNFKLEWLMLKSGIARFSLKSRSFTTDFPSGKLRGIPRDLCKSPLHSENYTIPIQMRICPKFKVFWFLSLFIPIISWGWLQKETVEDLCKGNKTATIPWELHCHLMNNCVVKCSHQNIFPCSTDETGEKKWAP